MGESKSKSKKTVTPEGADLSEAISFVLKDYNNGPVDAAAVTKMLKDEHPTWKLTDRRVNKFLKQHNTKNPAEADDDEATAEDGADDVPAKTSPKKYLSPRKSLKRFFSSKNKKKDTVDDLDTASVPSEPEKEPFVAEEIPPIEKEEDLDSAEETAEEEEPSPEPVVSIEEEGKVDKEIAYEVDNEKVDSSYDCFNPCSIM